MAEVLEFVIQGTDKYSKSFKNLTGKVLPSMKKAFLVTSAAVAATSAALIAITKSTANFEDKLAKLSTRLGISTEALSEYQYIAERTGVTVETVNLGFQRMTRRVSEAARGTGEASAALKELGLSAIDLNRLSVDEQFEAISGAMGGVEKQADKVRLAMRLFDTEGVALVQTMALGADGIEKLKQKAAELGVVISAKAAKNAEDYADSVTNLNTAVKGLKFAIGDELIPVFTVFNNNIADAISKNRDKIVKTLKDLAIKGFKAISVFLLGVAGLIDDLKPTINKITESLKGAWDFFTILPPQAQTIGLIGLIFLGSQGSAILISAFLIVDKLAAKADALGKKMSKIFGEENPLNQTFGKDDVLFDDIERGAEKATAAVDQMVSSHSSSLNTLKGAYNENLGSAKKDVDGLIASHEAATAATTASVLTTQEALAMLEEGFTATGNSTETLQEKVQGLLDKFAALFTGGDGDGEEVAEKIIPEEVFNRFEELNNRINIWKENVLSWQAGIGDLMTQTFDNVASGIGQAVAGAITGAADLGKALKAVFISVVQSVIAGLVEMGIKRLILKVLNLTAGLTEHVARIGQLSAQTYAGAFAATASIPIIGPVLAPGVAAGATAAMLAGQAGAQAAGQAAGAAGGIAHGGLDFVPKESTFLLDKGERVLSPNQNADLTSFLSGGGNNPIQIDNFNVDVMGDVTNPSVLMNMDENDWLEITIEKIIPALREANLLGIKPA